MKIPLKPRITEKTYRWISEDSKAANTYTFLVDPKARKEYIKRLVEDEYKVTVTDVRTISLPGKARRFKGIPGRTSDLKKALVRLAAGQRISAFDIETSQGDKTEKE